MMLSYDTSLAPPAEKETEFMPILAEALDPYLKGCESLANDLNAPDSYIFLINCFLVSKVTSIPFLYASTSCLTIIHTTGGARVVFLYENEN